MGKFIYSHSPLFWRGAGGEAHIEISTWHTGLYFYEIINDDGCSTGKFVVE
jgi:hypothetical protein